MRCVCLDLTVTFQRCRAAIVVAAASLVTTTGTYAADALKDYAIFGNSLVTIESFTDVTSGLVGSNRLIIWDNGEAIDGLKSGGDISGSIRVGTSQAPGVFAAQGDIYYGSLGNTTTPVYGDVTAGGSITPQRTVSSFKVNGRVIAGGSAIPTTFSSATGGIISHGTPPVVSALPMPSASQFTAGTQNIFKPVFYDLDLAPGAYGTVSLDGSASLTLHSGNYYLRTLLADSFLDLNLDLSGGPINVYVADNIVLESTSAISVRTLPSAAYVQINGMQPAPGFDYGLASQVTIETAKDIHYGGDLFGTLFAPNGSIVVDTFGTVTGAMIADTVDMGGSGSASSPALLPTGPTGYQFAHVPSARLFPVPEPGTFSLAVVAVLPSLLLLWRRRSAV